MTEAEGQLAGRPGVTRSAEAQSALSTAHVARQRISQPVGWWGFVLFLCSEVTLFGTILATYFYLNFGSAKWPPAGIEAPKITYPLIATGWLVLSSIPVWLAYQASRRADRGRAITLLSAAMVMQILYLAAQIVLFQQDLLKFTPQSSAYGSIYFTMLAADHAHVLLGILIDAAVLWHLATRGLTNYWLIGTRGTALYWYVVSFITVLVTFTQLSPSL